MFNRALGIVYERLGARMVLGFLFAGIAFGTLTRVLTAVWLARYLRFSSADFLLLLALGLSVVCVLAPPFVWLLRDLIGPILSWRSENRTAERAPDVWRAAVSLPRAIDVRGACGILAAVPLTVVPFTAFSGGPR